MQFLSMLVKNSDNCASCTRENKNGSLFCRKVPVDPTESETDLSPGAIAGIVVVLIIIAVVLGVLMFFVQRYYALQSRVQQDLADYPSFNSAAAAERRGSNQSEQSVHSHAESRCNGSYSDLASYHSDIESYPVSSGRYSSNRESLHSELGGVHNMAYSVGSKGSVTSSSSAAPSIMYVSTINVKEAKKPGENDTEKAKIVTNHNGQDLKSDGDVGKRISCNSDSGQMCSSGLVNGTPDKCNEKIPHHEDDELTVTTIGIRDRTSSEITISTIHARTLREKREEKKRVKSQDDVNVSIKPASHNSIASFYRARFNGGNTTNNRDSVVTISTVSSKDRSMSDVTISTLSKNSVYMGSNVQIPNGMGEVNRAFQKETNAITVDNRFSNVTLSTVLSGDQTLSEDENDSVFVRKEKAKMKILEMDNAKKKTPETDNALSQENVDPKENGVSTPERKTSSQENPITNGIEKNEVKLETNSKLPCNLNRTGSVQSRASEVSCSHNHENHRKKVMPVNSNVGIDTRARNTSSSSESSLSSNGCSECDSCPYCRDCASVMSDEITETNNNSGKFVSIVSTAMEATKD